MVTELARIAQAFGVAGRSFRGERAPIVRAARYSDEHFTYSFGPTMV
jgi:hypothetical protein